VSSQSSGDNVEALREQVDHLALAFIAPLRTYNDQTTHAAAGFLPKRNKGRTSLPHPKLVSKHAQQKTGEYPVTRWPGSSAIFFEAADLSKRRKDCRSAGNAMVYNRSTATVGECCLAE
jgi:hypothetical protein